MSACSLIDDDLSVCGEEMTIDYQVQLQTELSLQLRTDLVLETDTNVRMALERWLDPIFTDKAKDIDLRFYNDETDVIRHQIQDVINDNRTSYTIRLPKENYMHLAVANIADNHQAHISAGERSATMAVVLSDQTELSPLTTGVYTARLPMVVTDSTRRFDVHLYMVTAAVAVVIHTEACPDWQSLSGYMSGSASGFSIRDSVFYYTRSPKILMERVPIEQNAPMHKSPQSAPNDALCYATVSLPTQDDKPWSITATATLTDNRHTTTTLTIEKPLAAGDLRVFTFYMDADGKLNPDPESSQEVGATVEVDWGEGTEIEIEI